MPFDYEANVAAVNNNITAHNTTTATPDLSSGMTTRVRTIRVDDPDIAAIRWQELPAVFVRVQAAEEEPSGLGLTGPGATRVQKFKTAIYEVIGLYPRDGAHTTNRAHMTEVYRFAENAEGVFQQEFTLSGTALWCHPERTDFGAFQVEGGDVVKAFVTTLRARYLFR